MAEVDVLCICDGCKTLFTSAAENETLCGVCSRDAKNYPQPSYVPDVSKLVQRIYQLERQVQDLNKALCVNHILDEDRRTAILRIWSVLQKPVLLSDKTEFEDVLAASSNLHVSTTELLEVAKHWVWENL